MISNFLNICFLFLRRKEHEKCEFELHEVYAIDVLVSTGEGKVIVLITGK